MKKYLVQLVNILRENIFPLILARNKLFVQKNYKGNVNRLLTYFFPSHLFILCAFETIGLYGPRHTQYFCTEY